MLTGPEIERQVRLGRITIEPFDPGLVNPNSVDVRLHPRLLTYDSAVLDVRRDNPVSAVLIPEAGYVLEPGILYLGSTVEWFSTDHYVSVVEGKSSLGRLGLVVHSTAGFIDTGFSGAVTLELSVIHPLRVYPGMRVAQLCYFPTEGEVRLYAGKYQGQKGPVPSRSHLDFA